MLGAKQLCRGVARCSRVGAQSDLVSDKQPKIAWYKYISNIACDTLILKAIRCLLGFSGNKEPACLCLGGCAGVLGLGFDLVWAAGQPGGR